MKRLLSPLLVGTLCVGVNAQIFSAGFENNNGPISEWTTINADQNPIDDWMPVPEFNDEAWIQFYDFYDNKIAFSTSFYLNGQPANDWLISPEISIPNEGEPTLYWKAKSYDNTAPDTYAVKISTSNTELGSFTDLVVIEGEQAYEFNSRSLDLSDYAGQSVYIAFVNETNNGYFLAVDNVYISASQDCFAPSVATFDSEIDVNSYLSNPSSESISFDVSWGEMSDVDLYDVGVTTFDAAVTSDGTQTGTSKRYENMQLGTRYQMFVKNADCGSGWMGPKSIFTPTALPFDHGFEPTDENYGEYDSDGWTSDTWIMGVNSELASTGDGYIFSNTSTSVTANKWLYSYPIVIGDGETIQINLDAGFNNEATETGLLKIGITSSNEVGSYPTEYATFDVARGYNSITATFDSHPTGLVYVAIGNVTPATTDSYALRIDNIHIDKVLSVDDVSVSNRLSIYPNPVNSELHIKAYDQIKHLDIFDISGKLVLSKEGINTENASVNVNQLPKGVYILQLNFGNKVVTEKFIKEEK